MAGRNILPVVVLGTLALGTLVALGTACGGADERSPTDVVVAWVKAAERSSWDQGAPEQVYRLLNAASRSRLEERAELAGALAGRSFEPWDMIVRGRFHRRLAVRVGALRERVDGDRAVVIVHDAAGGRSATVRLVREEDGWRIDLEGMTGST